MKRPPREPVPPPQGSASDGKPTPLDVLFILSVSFTLVLVLLWMATTLLGRPLFTDLPQWLKDAASTLWKQAAAGLTGVGTAAASMALRKRFDKTRPLPNYLLLIPCFTAGLVLALWGVEKIIPNRTPPPRALVRVPIRVQLPPTNMADGSPGLPLVRVAIRSPQTKDVTDALLPTSDPDYPYRTEIDIPTSPDLNFLAELNPILGARYDPNFNGHQYEICLKANAGHPFPTPDTAEAAAVLVKLKCLSTGKCPRATNEASYAMSCEEPEGRSGDSLPVVFAAGPTQQDPQPGWIVPSLDSLSKMAEPARVGYTRFDVMFTPEGQAREANRYYYLLRVNGQPIYIDGFLPDRTIVPLQKGQNWISFALQNLNFTGEYDGFEKLHLTVIFLKGGDVVYRQELERDYAALRDAPAIQPIQTAVGTFIWTGKYMVPTNENKYEILLASADCGDPPRKDCVVRAVNAKKQFDRDDLKFNDKSVVMVVRPPLRKPPAYGLALGLVEPTRQVQFTFNAEEAAQLCHWASEHLGQGKAGRLIQPDLNRYEVATRGYTRCR